MARALWKGAISFGLVHVPVELYSAAKQNNLDLDLLDKRTMDPIGYQRINKKTGKEVAWDQIVKAYEYKDGRYVVLGDEDFKRANPVATQTVEILAFVEPSEIPIVYYDTPYYLVPGKRGEKVYALLRETMKRAQRVAIASVVISTRQHLAAVVPRGRILILNTLRYADEIRPIDEFDLPAESPKAAQLNAKEIEMAMQLLKNMGEKWKPEQYHDTYREDILARVKEKVKAGETEVVAEPEKEEQPRRTAEVIDLMALLKGSLGKRTGGAAATSAHRASKAGKPKASARKAASDESSASKKTRSAARKRA